MWFVENTWSGGSSIDVVRMDNVLSSSPVFTDQNLTVASYAIPPAAAQPGGTTIDTGDCRTLNVEWNNNYLAAAFNSTAGSDAAAAWIEIGTAGSQPIVVQQGIIHPGTGVATYFPSVAVDASGDLALDYMESSTTENPSVYVTGRLAADAAGAMEPALLARGGTGTLYASRAGDYSGISPDPSASGSFWVCNECGDAIQAWGTWVALFQVSSASSSGDTAPSISTPASASPTPVAGTSTVLSVLGADDTGESSLSYTWSVVATPSGAALPNFSSNGNNSSKTTTANFYRAGNYTFEATVTDPAGLTATSAVTVMVNQTLTSIAVAPTNATLPDNTSQQFTASGLDQFGQALTVQPAFAWSVQSGGIGTISSGGKYSSPQSGAGSASIWASTGMMGGSATVTITSVPAAPTNLTATAVSAQQVNLIWNESSNNSSGFTIQRSANGGQSWNQIAKVSGSVTAYSDKTVSKNKNYRYRVQAYNSAGSSAWSNVASVTTPIHAPIPTGDYPTPDVPERLPGHSADARPTAGDSGSMNQAFSTRNNWEPAVGSLNPFSTEQKPGARAGHTIRQQALDLLFALWRMQLTPGLDMDLR
jgi:hypothetical protein